MSYPHFRKHPHLQDGPGGADVYIYIADRQKLPAKPSAIRSYFGNTLYEGELLEHQRQAVGPSR